LRKKKEKNGREMKENQRETTFNPAAFGAALST